MNDKEEPDLLLVLIMLFTIALCILTFIDYIWRLIAAT